MINNNYKIIYLPRVLNNAAGAEFFVIISTVNAFEEEYRIIWQVTKNINNPLRLWREARQNTVCISWQ